MNLMKRNHFQNLLSLENEFNRLFDFNNEGLTRWQPSVDVYETQDEVVAEAECPGLSPEDLNVTLENNVLTVTGEKKSNTENKTENYHRVERSYGKFSRSFTLPSSVDAENISAEYRNGVVRIAMPKKEVAKAKTIKIKSSLEDAPKAIGMGAGGS